MSDDVVVDETSVKTFIFYLIIQQIEKNPRENKYADFRNKSNKFVIDSQSLFMVNLTNV